MGRRRRYYDPGANPQPVSADKRHAIAAAAAAMAVVGGFGENPHLRSGRGLRQSRRKVTTADAERLRQANAKRDRRAQKRREQAEGE